MQPSKKGSSYNYFYFMSKILHCCTAVLFSIVAALSSPPIASRFRDIIFRSRNPFVDSDFESFPQLYFPSSQPFVTSSVVAIFHRLRPQIASATLSSVDAAFRLSATPSVDAAFRRLLASTISYSIVAAFRRLFTTSSAIAALHRLRPQVA